MQKFTFSRQRTNLFTDQQNLLATEQEQLLPFINHAFSKENFKKQIREKLSSYTQETRDKLVHSLKETYSKIEKRKEEENNLNLLSKDKTFTITTGHQLSIFTGPLFFIYKIIHVIRLCEELKKEYDEYNFVPVFWMASEDHDFEEISSVEVFGKSFNWSSEEKGAVGRFSIEGLDEIKNEIVSFFSNQEGSEVEELMKAYSGKNLSEATFNLVRELFGKYGLIIVDGDNSELKRIFLPVIEKEIKERFSFSAVKKKGDELTKHGLKLQLNPREVNLFYLDDQFRQRIIHTKQDFFIEEVGQKTSEQLLFELYNHPERFSPNVVLRPVFQETILPNLCYVGGVGELSYWLQLKGVFDKLDLPYPLIQARASVLWIDPISSKKIEKAELTLEDLFLDQSVVKKQYLKETSGDELHFEEIDKSTETLKTAIMEQIMRTDPHLEKFGYAEISRLEKQIETVKEKLFKTVKLKHENTLKNIEQIYDRLFPNEGMQERSVNLLSICPDGKVSSKIEIIHEMIDPFDPDFVVIKE